MDAGGVQWGTVAEWVGIIGGAVVFIGTQIVLFTINRITVKQHGETLSKVVTDIELIKKKEIALETLAACLDKATGHDKEMTELKENVVTFEKHEELQTKCQKNMSVLIEGIAKRNDELGEIIEDFRQTITKQNEVLATLSVSVATLGTKLDERTGNRPGNSQYVV